MRRREENLRSLPSPRLEGHRVTKEVQRAGTSGVLVFAADFRGPAALACQVKSLRPCSDHCLDTGSSTSSLSLDYTDRISSSAHGQQCGRAGAVERNTEGLPTPPVIKIEPPAPGNVTELDRAPDR